MKLLLTTSIVLASFLFLTNDILAQESNFSKYDDLSKFSLAKQKDSIKKAWTVPAIYKNKETQKKYADIWNDRSDFLVNAMQANNFIHNKAIYNYVDAIIQQLRKSNPTVITAPLLLLIDRSESVNAYSIGNNVIAVNLGLLSFVQNREELALIIGHELAHNFLQHAENAMQQKAELLTSDEYKESLNDVLTSKYGRLSRLKEVLKGYSFSRSKHSRYKESEADSLAIVMLKNSNINFNAENFLRLDSADNEYKTELKSGVKNYFTSLNVPLDDQWLVKKSKGLSSRSYNFSKGEDLSDSLKTHPECKERYEQTKSLTTTAATYTPIPTDIRELADKMIVWNLYDNMSLTPALFRILLLRDNGAKDQWYDAMTFNIFAGLSYADKKLNRFNSIGVVPKESISKDYFTVQTLMEQIPADKLKETVKTMSGLSFWSTASADSKAFKTFLNALLSSENLSNREQENYSKDFMKNYQNSMYAEVAERFK